MSRPSAARVEDGRKTKTKDLILESALGLFAERGYARTSVQDIAASVGVSAPALYKHFKNKQAIYDELIKIVRRGYDNDMNVLRIDFLEGLEMRAEFAEAAEDRQINILQQLFSHLLDEETPNLFRRFMKAEQLNEPDLAELYDHRYIDAQYIAFEVLMQELVDKGIMQGGDVHAMAVEYASPFIVYMELCDREPMRKQEALNAIAAHIKQFNAAHMIEN